VEPFGGRLSDMDHTEEVKRLFGNDEYAVKTTGVVIERAEPQKAVCSLEITERHKNSIGVVMGGAIYTLADLAFAVASNVGQPLTVTLEGQMTYLRPAKSGKLIAETFCEKSGEKTCSYRVDICDENGKYIASAKFIGFRA